MRALLFALLVLVPPPKPARIYLKDPDVMVCGRSSTGWSCRPAAAVTAFLLQNASDQCTE